jgi:hypothetical protein
MPTNYVISIAGFTGLIGLSAGSGITISTTTGACGATFTISSTVSGGGGGSTFIPDLRPLGVTADIIAMRNGGWTLAKPNTISMPLPNLASIVTSIGGLTTWSTKLFASTGTTSWITLGNGTFLCYNKAEIDPFHIVNGGYHLGPASQLTILQGVGVTWPSGTITNQTNTQGGAPGSNPENLWTSWMDGTYMVHSGWAIRLSGATSGGVGAGGGYGGGIQPL